MFDYKLVISENDNFIDFKILENNKNDKNFIFIVNEGTASTAEIIIQIYNLINLSQISPTIHSDN